MPSYYVYSQGSAIQAGKKNVFFLSVKSYSIGNVTVILITCSNCSQQQEDHLTVAHVRGRWGGTPHITESQPISGSRGHGVTPGQKVMQWGGDGGTRAHTDHKSAISSFHLLTNAHSAAVGRGGQRLAPNIKDISIILSENIYIYKYTHLYIYT